MANQWEGLIAEVAPQIFTTILDDTVRTRFEWMQLEREGRIQLGVDGSFEATYPIDFKEAMPTAFGDGMAPVYQRRLYTTNAKMDWRAMIDTDVMHWVEKTMRQTNKQIVDRYGRALTKLSEGIMKELGRQIYVDGNAAATITKWHGIESFMGSGTTVTADIIDEPSDTYNDLSTALEARGGTWTTAYTTASLQCPNTNNAHDWPEGSGSSEYDYYSPKKANWSSTNWGTGTATWGDNCERVLRRMGQWLTTGTGETAKEIVVVMAGKLLTEFKDRMSAKNRHMVPLPQYADLGFPNVLSFEGMSLTSSFECPVNTAYFFNFSKVDAMFLTGEAVVTEGPTWDKPSESYLFSAKTMGNFRWRPKYFGKAKNYA